ncbi:MAG TPA: DUF4038 domain-containing protein [Verrucomicrobiae bacterium]|nr:DUF4038 domain-containing protein [Verrucomicrobiae bacterium]
MMTSLISNAQKPIRKLALALCLMALPLAAKAKLSLVAQWGRFETSFRSGVSYASPFQQCTLKVTFTSPGGETNDVYGFWDGGSTWRVRFSPDRPGRWTYRTSCSDLANARLNDQTGEFVCTSPTSESRFAQHGPVQVARDRHHFEHADHSPFFWMADVAWDAPRLSNARDWATYLQVRSSQSFSAVQWAAAPGADEKNHSAYSGQKRITIDPEYFQRLDEKIELMNRAGLLSVIAPLALPSPLVQNSGVTNDLPEDQAALLVRYMVARWGAYDVAWLLTSDPNDGERWLKIGREVFGEIRHGPVVALPTPSASGFAFQNEDWVDAFGFGTGQYLSNNALQWLIAGPLSREWKIEPTRPLINVLPPMENGLAAQGHERITAEDVRRIAWWSLLLMPPAGVSYGAQDVANWNPAVQSKLPTWQLSLFLPGAKQMRHITELFESANWRSLRPAPHSLAIQPGSNSPRHYVTASQTEEKDLSVIYVPEDRTLEVYLNALPPSPTIEWLNPRTGQKSPAVAVVGARTCQLPTPDAGDWVLVMKTGK